MQKLAILADIHGNLLALEAVLAKIDAECIEHVVCLGDIATLGPQPREVIARLRALGCSVVMGDIDAILLALQRDESTITMRDDGRDGWTNEDFDRWCANLQQISVPVLAKPFHLSSPLAVIKQSAMRLRSAPEQ